MSGKLALQFDQDPEEAGVVIIAWGLPSFIDAKRKFEPQGWYTLENHTPEH